MSLVLDNLKKIKKQKGGGSVPPNMVNLAPKKSRRSGRPNPVLLILLVLAVVGAGIVFYMDSGGRKYKVVKPARVQPSPPVAKAPSQPRPVTNKKPAQVAPAITPEQIQAKIDAAVDDALANAEKSFIDRMDSSRDANIQRAESVDALPAPFDNDPAVVAAKAPVTLPPAVQEDTETVSGEQEEKVAEQIQKVQKPVMTDVQKAVFEKKINYNTLITAGEKALRSGRYLTAQEKYIEALSIKPSEAALSNLIKAKIGEGDIHSVDSILTKYKGLVTEKVITAAALDLEFAGFPKEGLALLSKYRGSFTSDGRIFYTAGQIQERRQEYTKAEIAYKTALESFPADAYMQYAYARMLDTNKKLELAVSAYQQIDKLDADASLKKTALERAAMISSYLKSVKENN